MHEPEEADAQRAPAERMDGAKSKFHIESTAGKSQVQVRVFGADALYQMQLGHFPNIHMVHYG